MLDLQSLNLEVPTASDLKITDRSKEAKMAARRLRREIARRIEKLDSASLVAAARCFFPAAKPEDSVEALALAIAGALEKIEDFKAKIDNARDEERARLRPLISAAIRRVLDLAGVPEAVEGKLREIDVQEREKSANLQKLGLNDERVSRLLTEEFTERRAKLQVQAAKLREERGAWGKFLQTYDESDLPAVELAM
ncbi:MAG: hypothetical protein LBS70_02720 [Candidatus Accumulibacter sp.]|jgi:hypothetical protein|nr:hypothetical protein [Accumulibacter sp.]